MKLVVHPSAERFLTVARDFLVAREAEHNLILGIAATVAEKPDRFGDEPPFFGTIHDVDESVVAAALRTPPHQLVMTDANDAARALLLDDARARWGTSLPGVLGPVATARAFADAWCAATSTTKGAATSERIYRLDRVEPVHGVKGAMRDATHADREYVIEKWKAFTEEALPGQRDERDQSERAVNARLASATSGIVLWIVDDKPVSLAGFAGPTPNGIRIGPVYTPRKHRGNGYASALVATLSQRLLDGGKRFCFLFTDLANPTSNSIYQKIGYKPVVDVEQISFTR